MVPWAVGGKGRGRGRWNTPQLTASDSGAACGAPSLEVLPWLVLPAGVVGLHRGQPLVSLHVVDGGGRRGWGYPAEDAPVAKEVCSIVQPATSSRPSTLCLCQHGHGATVCEFGHLHLQGWECVEGSLEASCTPQVLSCTGAPTPPPYIRGEGMGLS